MKASALFLLLFSAIINYGCAKDELTVQVVRNPSVKFDADSGVSWQADRTSFSPLAKVVVYPSDTSSQGVLYNRLTMQSTGRDNAGNNLQLIITFDALDVAQLVGDYSTVYSAQRGLAEVQLYDITNNSNLAAYSLCSGSGNSAHIQIKRQHFLERLITGSFSMTLCNLRDSSRKINIINGTITDIRY